MNASTPEVAGLTVGCKVMKQVIHKPISIRPNWILDVKTHFSVRCAERKLTGSASYCVFRNVPLFSSTLRGMQSGQMFTRIRKGDG
jgi:hypothetical protein